MESQQQKLAAALLFVVALWISEAMPIPIGGLMGIVLIVMIGVAPVDVGIPIMVSALGI